MRDIITDIIVGACRAQGLSAVLVNEGTARGLDDSHIVDLDVAHDAAAQGTGWWVESVEDADGNKVWRA